MAGSKSDYLESALLAHVLGKTAYTAPTTLYLALFTDSNTQTQRDAGTVTEVSGNAYARVSITNNTTNWPAPSGTAPTTSTNGVTFTFATPTPAGWGTVTAWGIYDALTTGNLLYHGDLTASKVINAGDTVSFASSAIVITED